MIAVWRCEQISGLCQLDDLISPLLVIALSGHLNVLSCISVLCRSYAGLACGILAT